MEIEEKEGREEVMNGKIGKEKSTKTVFPLDLPFHSYSSSH